jgi:cell division protein FtsZ
VTPTFAARRVEPTPPPPVRPEPVIHAAEPAPRALEPIVDPWVEAYDAGMVAPTPAAPAPEDFAPAPVRASTPLKVEQGDLYLDRGVAAETSESEDRGDHRKNGWSLFGRGRRQAAPAPEPTYTPPPSRAAAAPRGPAAAQPAYDMAPEAEDDDLEIPSFLRRLAN